ncbi:arginine methyltransferase, partial [Haematococcus lacustris]
VASLGASKVQVALRPGKGVPAPRPPWKEEWGGGVSIENPHVQRLSYCKLIEADLLQRLPSGRGHCVTRDVTHVAAHCGSLFLDPVSLSHSLCHLSLLEA